MSEENKNEIINPRDSWNVKKEEQSQICENEAPRSKVALWFENFWYHHKWKTIIISFFTIVLAVCLLQLTENEKLDIEVLYAGPVNITVPHRENIIMAYESVMQGDYNKDGEKNVGLYALFIMSGEQIQNVYDKAEPSESPYINTQIIAQDKQTFDTEIMAGDSVICMLDPWLYDYVRDAGGFLTLEEVLGYVPEGTDEYGCGIKLSSTAFGQFFSGVSDLPEDTVLCVRRLSTFSQLKGKKQAAEKHEYALDVFRDVMAFAAKN